MQEAALDKRYKEVAPDLDAWWRIATKAKWNRLEDVQQPYPSAEAVRVGKETYTVFNIRGNRFRLIVNITYPSQTIFVKYFLTHAEYDRDQWKRALKKAQSEREQSK